MKLMQTLGVAVRALHDLDAISPFLQDLGKCHIRYGVSKDQYELVKVALLSMRENCLEQDYTPEMQEAWIAAYDLIAGITTSAYE